MTSLNCYSLQVYSLQLSRLCQKSISDIWLLPPVTSLHGPRDQRHGDGHYGAEDSSCQDVRWVVFVVGDPGEAAVPGVAEQTNLHSQLSQSI